MLLKYKVNEFKYPHLTDKKFTIIFQDNPNLMESKQVDFIIDGLKDFGLTKFEAEIALDDGYCLLSNSFELFEIMQALEKLTHDYDCSYSLCDWDILNNLDKFVKEKKFDKAGDEFYKLWLLIPTLKGYAIVRQSKDIPFKFWEKFWE